MADEKDNISRRNFLAVLTGAVGAVGGACGAVPFVKSLLPTKDLIASGVMKVDISDIKEGELKTIMWRKQPVFIMKRNQEMIDATEKTDASTLADPAETADRYMEKELFVSLGICTHLGCIPKFFPKGVEGIDQPGFYCPCHGGKYDTLGRRIAGPPPENLHLVPYKKIDENTLVIGNESFAGFGENVRKIGDLPSA